MNIEDEENMTQEQINALGDLAHELGVVNGPVISNCVLEWGIARKLDPKPVRFKRLYWSESELWRILPTIDENEVVDNWEWEPMEFCSRGDAMLVLINAMSREGFDYDICVWRGTENYQLASFARINDRALKYEARFDRVEDMPRAVAMSAARALGINVGKSANQEPKKLDA